MSDETAPADAGETDAPPRLIVAGNASVDLLLGPLTPWPTPGTEVVVDRSAWRVGGALGNTALALAQLGVGARLVWDVGDDMLGRWLSERMAHAGDRPRVLDVATSLTVALNHPDGERTFVSHLGHLARSESDALAAAIEVARAGDLLFVGGSFLLPRWRPELPALFARAQRRGVLTALDTGWPTEGWSADVRAQVDATLAHVDLFLPNLDEARGLLNAPDADACAALARLAERVAGTTVLKLGAEGAALAEDGGVFTEPAPTVRVHDTVGAGDTFNALFLVGVHDGMRVRSALRRAVRATSNALASAPRRLPSWATLRTHADDRFDSTSMLEAAR